jgi:hypothetical protein
MVNYTETNKIINNKLDTLTIQTPLIYLFKSKLIQWFILYTYINIYVYVICVVQALYYFIDSSMLHYLFNPSLYILMHVMYFPPLLTIKLPQLPSEALTIVSLLWPS